MKLVNTIPVAPVGEDEALLPRKASPSCRGLVVRAAAISLALGFVASAATGGVSTTSLSSKNHAGRFETPKGGKYGNVKVKAGETYLDWQKYVECWTPKGQGYYPPGALAEAKGWPGKMSKESAWCNGIDWGACDGCTEDNKGGKFVWADLKDSDKVGSYPYPKNKPDKYPYWDNLGADWLYGGIYVYGEYPDDDDLESANVYVDDEPYD